MNKQTNNNLEKLNTLRENNIIDILTNIREAIISMNPT